MDQNIRPGCEHTPVRVVNTSSRPGQKKSVFENGCKTNTIISTDMKLISWMGKYVSFVLST